MAFTYFFRDMQTLERIVEIALPIISGRTRINVWDAGCAMGQEPYSLSILFAESMGKFAYKNLRITASDIDGSNLFGDIIANGEYQSEEVERIPKHLFSKYFVPSEKENHFQLVPDIRNSVSFIQHDLLTLQKLGSDMSLIVCKNVLLHFTAEERVKVITMFHQSLIDGGVFAMEQTQKLPPELNELFTQVYPDAQVFQKNITS